MEINKINDMNSKNEKYINNAKIWGKERKFNERTLALQEMIKTARKFYPDIVALLRTELYKERLEITLKNIRRKRQSIIGR